MKVDVWPLWHVHLVGESAMRPASTALGAPCGVAPPCAQECAASSRLAWHADHGTVGRIQLRFLGSIAAVIARITVATNADATGAGAGTAARRLSATKVLEAAAKGIVWEGGAEVLHAA